MKTPTQQFIQDAIAGGYGSDLFLGVSEGSQVYDHMTLKLLLDPLFWQAVGETRGWYVGELCDAYGNCRRDDEWLQKQHRFIDHLANGNDIDTALGKLQ